MKRFGLFCLALLPVTLSAMKDDDPSVKKPFLLKSNPHLIAYTYNSSSLNKTEHLDDTLKTIRIKETFFKQLCVQASKATDIEVQPFKELLQKLRNGAIDTKDGFFFMTEKDLKHRLLSYVPCGTMHEKTVYVINDKKVHIGWCGFATELDNIYNQILRDKEPKKETSLDDDIFKFDDNGKLRGEGYRGLDLKHSGQEPLPYNYDFAQDKKHNDAICQEFMLLIKQ